MFTEGESHGFFSDIKTIFRTGLQLAQAHQPTPGHIEQPDPGPVLDMLQAAKAGFMGSEVATQIPPYTAVKIGDYFEQTRPFDTHDIQLAAVLEGRALPVVLTEATTQLATWNITEITLFHAAATDHRTTDGFFLPQGRVKVAWPDMRAPENRFSALDQVDLATQEVAYDPDPSPLAVSRADAFYRTGHRLLAAFSHHMGRR